VKCHTQLEVFETKWPGLSIEQLLHKLRQIQQFVLLYPPQGEKGPPAAAIVRSKQTLPQQQLAMRADNDCAEVFPSAAKRDDGETRDASLNWLRRGTKCRFPVEYFVVLSQQCWLMNIGRPVRP